MTSGQTGKRTDEPTDEREVLGRTDGRTDGGASGVEIGERQTLEAVVSVCFAADKTESPQGTGTEGREGGGRLVILVGLCLAPHKACSRTHISEPRFLKGRWMGFFFLSL